MHLLVSWLHWHSSHCLLELQNGLQRFALGRESAVWWGLFRVPWKFFGNIWGAFTGSVATACDCIWQFDHQQKSQANFAINWCEHTKQIVMPIAVISQAILFPCSSVLHNLKSLFIKSPNLISCLYRWFTAKTGTLDKCNEDIKLLCLIPGQQSKNAWNPP